MKKLMLMCALAGVALLFAGCSSLQAVGASKLSGQSLTPAGNTVAHVSASAGGFYFLWIPLFVGSDVISDFRFDLSVDHLHGQSAVTD